MSRTIKINCGVSKGDPPAAIRAEIEMIIPEGISHAQLYKELAAQAEDCIKSAICSRLDPSPVHISELTKVAKDFQTTRGAEFARGWLQAALDPARYAVSDELVISLIE